MKKTTGEAEPKHKESKDSVLLSCQNLSVSISPSAVSTDRFLCVDSRRTGEFLLTSLSSFFLATLCSEGISPDTD